MGWDRGDVCAGAQGRRGCAVLLPPLQQSPALTVRHALDCVLDMLFGLGKVITREALCFPDVIFHKNNQGGAELRLAANVE